MASVSDTDPVRGHLDHCGRNTVRTNSHVVDGLARNELQVKDCPCDIEANVGERPDIGSCVWISTVGADCHLVVVDLMMLPD